MLTSCYNLVYGNEDTASRGILHVELRQKPEGVYLRVFANETLHWKGEIYKQGNCWYLARPIFTSPEVAHLIPLIKGGVGGKCYLSVLLAPIAATIFGDGIFPPLRCSTK